MGEKGIGGGVVGGVPDTSSVIEKTTTSVVTSVTEVGTDLASTLQDKALGAVADETVRAARERMSSPEDGSATGTAPAETPKA